MGLACARGESAHLSSPKVTKAHAVVASSCVRPSQQPGQVTKLRESMIFLSDLAVVVALFARPCHRGTTAIRSAAVDIGRHSLAIIPRPGHNNEALLAHFRMLAEKLRAKSKTQLAKLALGLRRSGLVSERVTGS